MKLSTIGLLALLTLTSAKQNENLRKNNQIKVKDNDNLKKKIKVKVQGKLLSANTVSDGNACYPKCTNVFSDQGCEVMNGGDYSLGTFYCKVDAPCAPGEKGDPSFTCNIGGINDMQAEDLSTSCGGVGFDIGLMVGRDEYEVGSRGDVHFSSMCTCDSCDCNPCEQGQRCLPKFNGPNGGFKCLGKK